MNIFVLDNQIQKIAEYHVDKHVVKMVLESTQMLCTVNNIHNTPSPYKSCHSNHPCTRWAGYSLENWLWLKELGLALAHEYTYRYGKIHKCQYILEHLQEPPIPDTPRTLPPKCMPSQFQKHDLITAYRAYYQSYKHSFAKWTKRDTPPWWTISRTEDEIREWRDPHTMALLAELKGQ